MENKERWQGLLILLCQVWGFSTVTYLNGLTNGRQFKIKTVFHCKKKDTITHDVSTGQSSI